MKTVLAVIGAIVVLGIIVVVGAGFWAYKNGGAKLTKMAETEIEKFIQDKHPSEEAANSLRRVINAAKKQETVPALMLVGAAGKAVKDNVVTEDEIKVLNEGSQMAEQRPLSKDDVKMFMDHMEKASPTTVAPPTQPMKKTGI